MSLFRPRTLKASEEAEVLGIARGLVNAQAKAGTIEIRSVLKDALIDAGYVRGITERSERVNSLMRALGAALKPEQANDVGIWGRASNGTDIRNALDLARSYRL